MNAHRDQVFLIDDNADVRQHLGNLVRQMGYALDTFESADDFFARANTTVTASPCVLLMDMRMPGPSGLDIQRQLISRGWVFPIVFISGESKVQEVIDSMKLGAVDFLLKPVRHVELSRALAAAVARARTLHDAQQRQVLVSRKFDQLSAREKALLGLIVRGHTNRGIAQVAGLQPDTVKKYRAAIFEKMDVVDTAELIALCEGVSFPRNEPA
jgi:FixJ family two-component response regulator